MLSPDHVVQILTFWGSAFLLTTFLYNESTYQTKMLGGERGYGLKLSRRNQICELCMGIQGSLHDTNPNNALFKKEINHNQYAFALLDPPMAFSRHYSAVCFRFRVFDVAPASLPLSLARWQHHLRS